MELQTDLKSSLRNVIPLFSSKVSCGFPSPADDYLESKLDLHEHLIKKPNATFFVRAQGLSMMNAGIFDNDLLIIDRSIKPTHNMIVLAVLNGEFTLKRLIKLGQVLELRPENPNFKSILVTSEMEFSVWGVATYCIHSLGRT
jgi:DNA polymerase V